MIPEKNLVITNTFCLWRYQLPLILIIIHSLIPLPTLHKVLLVGWFGTNRQVGGSRVGFYFKKY